MKTIIITGANSGIGKKSFLKFILDGHHVILGCRNQESAQFVISEASKEIPGLEGRVTSIHLDLESFASVRNFARIIREKFSQIDLLIHNAGAFNHGIKSFQKTQDGFELTYQVNVLSPYLLNRELYEVLEKSPKPQIIYASTTNIKYFFDPKRKVNLKDMTPHNEPYNSYKMYGDSKICQLAMMFSESEKHPNIQMNSVLIPAVKIDPKSRKKLSLFFRVLAVLQSPFSIPQEIIADCYFFLSESNLNKILINSKKEIVKPVDYANSIGEHYTNLFTDKHYPNYCHNEDLKKELLNVLDRI
ncbi:MAG: SDR family NAD(P)-dependent oxidoreductase [Leptospiraceae bacterium]|nr:SDR family NAD(P)-dependent oxidoreductase [Leptospiraceae bacterium]MBL0262777.1 SDR family NAD(P)-dependent oxidoreductase [Leptospiraceae bacterium]